MGDNLETEINVYLDLFITLPSITASNSLGVVNPSTIDIPLTPTKDLLKLTVLSPFFPCYSLLEYAFYYT